MEIRIAFQRQTRLTRWLTDKDLVSFDLGLLPDAYLEYQSDALTYSAFVEYDRGTRPHGRLEAKARGYLDLAFSARFEQHVGRRYFRALFITDSAKRLGTMSETMARITDKVMRLTTLAQLTDQGPLAAIWQRPGAHTLESLTTS